MPPSIIASVCSLVLAGVIAFGNTQAQWRCQRHQAAGHEAVHRPAGKRLRDARGSEGGERQAHPLHGRYAPAPGADREPAAERAAVAPESFWPLAATKLSLRQTTLRPASSPLAIDRLSFFYM